MHIGFLRRLLVLSLFLAWATAGFSEGSKEIYIGSKNTSLFLCNDFAGKCNSGGGDRTQFSVYGCEETSRLYFVTANAQEIVYMGFNVSDIPSNCHGVFRIKNLAGTIVYNQTNIPASSTGFINTITEARNGPVQIYGTGGYSAINWHPPVPGTYYIEFQEVNNSSGNFQTDNNGFNLDLFDLTVYDSVTHLKKLGRLYSKAWQLYEENTHFSGTSYIYSIDSIITSAAFNDLKGGHWVQFCNQWGCANTGNFLSDRKSLNNSQAYMPQYLQFLNIPDPVLFPPGQVLGQIVPPIPWGERNCNDGTILFHVTVNKAGNIEIDLTFPLPYTSRILTAIVAAGENLIPWDGKDGSGTNIPNNVLINFTVKYVNGLTNLPLYDVEGNPNGFTVTIIAPTGATPTVFWDDTNISTGGSNLSGCTSPPGCHVWSNPFGDHHTMNTWWYNVSSTTTSLSLNEWRKPQALTINQQPPQSYCAGTNGVTFSVNPETNTEQYHWSYTGTGATILQINPSDPFVTVNFSTSATSGNIQVYGTNTNCGSNPGPTSSLAVTIKPAPSVNPPLTKSICSGSNTAISLTSTPSGANFSWITPPPTCTSNIVSCPAGSSNGTQINDILSVNNLNSGTVTYHITGTLNGCTGPQANYVVTVNPLPNVIINSSTPNVCSGQATNIQLSSSVPAATFTWTATGSSGNVTGFSNGSGNQIIQTLTVNGFTVETVTYAITPTVSGCTPGTPTNYVVTVNPSPNLGNFPASTVVCSGSPTNVLLTSNVPGTTFTWTCTPSSANVTGFSTSTFPTAFLNQVLYNSGTSTETVTYHMLPQINGCFGTVSDYIVYVNPKPHLTTSPFSQTICSGGSTSITLTSNLPSTSFSWTVQLASGNVTGFSNGMGNQITQTLTNLNSFNGVVNYKIAFGTIFCAGNDSIFPVSLLPEPNLSNSPATGQVCTNTNANITLTSDVPGTLFTWTANGSSPQVSGYQNNSTPGLTIADLLINSGNSVETVTYHVTPHANGCDGEVTEFILYVNPVPSVTNTPLNQEQCSNQATGILLTSGVAGTVFTWTATGSSPMVSGFSGSSIPKTAINQTLLNNGSTTETVTYTITPEVGGCTGPTVNYVVTVYAAPNVANNPLFQQQCNNQSTGINLVSNVAGTLYTWSATGSSAQVTGYSGNLVPSAAIHHTLVNAGYSIETVTYHIIPAYSGCVGEAVDYTVTVYPTPDLSNSPLLLQLCNNSSTNLTLTSHVANALFTWNCFPSSGNITGYANSSTPTTSLNQTLVNQGVAVESVTYQILPTANGCTGPVTDFVVSVVQSPDVYFNPPAQTLCSQQTTNIQVLSHVPGTTFTWSASAASPFVSGFSGGAGNLIQQTLTNTGTTIETVTYSVLPSVSGCQAGTTQSVVVTVNPKPAVTNTTTAFQQCSAIPANINLTSEVSGTGFTWTASGSSGNVSGYLAGSGLAIQQTLINKGFSTEMVTYQVTPSANGCAGAMVPFTVTVFPVPDTWTTPPTQALCPLQTTNLSNHSHVTGTTFNWAAAGSSAQATGFSPGSGNTIQQTLDNTGYAIEWVTYTVTPFAKGCQGTSRDATVTMYPAPPVSFTACFDPVVTTNSKPFRIRGGIPLGGTYSGPGISNAIFNPATSGPGSFTLTYSKTNSYGCSKSATQSLTVVTPSSFTCGSNFTDVRDNQSYPTIQIGTQCWMASNLNYGSPISGDLTQRDNCIPEKFCYGDSPASCASLGGLYQWDELMRYDDTPVTQGLCPPAWHLPTEAEWTLLFNQYLGNGFAGSPLKYSGYSGFNALLDGTRFKNVNWNFLDFATLLWSSTPHGPEKAWAHGMNGYNPSTSLYSAGRSNAFSVRCIKD